MYDFAIVALLALATVKLVDFLTDNLGGLDRFRSLLTFVVAGGESIVAAADTPLRDQPISCEIGCRNTASDSIDPNATQVISAPTATTTQPMRRDNDRRWP